MANKDGGNERPLYMISIAAKLAGTHPQTLRIYERLGLIHPKRTMGKTRLYSDSDIELVGIIQTLTQENGVNLAGVKMILRLEEEVIIARSVINNAKKRIEELEQETEEEIKRVRKAFKKEIMILPSKEIVKKNFHNSEVEINENR